jgi:hypothetical protein
MNSQELILRQEQIYTKEIADCIPFHKIGRYSFRPSLRREYALHATACVFCQTRLESATRIYHPYAADLAELIGGRIPSEDTEKLNRHVESCATCKAIVRIKWFRGLAAEIARAGIELVPAPVPSMNFAFHFSADHSGREPAYAEIQCQGLVIRLDEDNGDMLVRARSIEPAPDVNRISLALVGESDIAECVSEWSATDRWHATVRSSDFLRVATTHSEVQLFAVLTDKQGGIIT